MEDVARGFELAIESPGKDTKVYNLGSGQTTSINELAEIVRDHTEDLYDRNVEIKHVEPPEARSEAEEEFDYSIEKISRELEYEPEYTLRGGIMDILRS